VRITDLYGAAPCYPPPRAIESLPDNVLLNIFGFYQQLAYEYSQLNVWQTLVHVCRRWRYVVFESPLRLNLQLECDTRTPVKKGLDIWPPFPIVVRNTLPWRPHVALDPNDNIIAALEHHDRVCTIYLECPTRPLLEQSLTVMQVPFPVLTSLKLEFVDKSVPAPVLPDTFLGGSAPRLQDFALYGIPSPSLPKLLPSCHDLVVVHLWNIPDTGYISPQAMATSLIPLTRLDFLGIGFESPASSPNRRHRSPPPLARIDLPALTRLFFHGTSEYFEDLIAQIDTPVISLIHTEFFNQLVFDFPQFLQFVGRTNLQGSFERARLSFKKDFAEITLDPGFYVRTFCGAFDWQVSGLAQICSQFSSFCSHLEHLDVKWDGQNRWDTNDMDHTQWLELFHPFTSLQRLVMPTGLEELIAPALQELTGEGAIEVLPALPNRSPEWSWKRSASKAPEPTITVRQLSNHHASITLDL
jgi:F-box-like